MAEPAIEIFFPYEIDAVAGEDLRQLVFDIEDAKTDDLIGLEVDEDIDVTVRPEIIRQHGTEQSQPADVMPAAEVGDPCAVDCYPDTHTRMHTIFVTGAGTGREPSSE